MKKMDNKTLQARVNAALDKVRPYLIVDGGNIDLVEITKDLKVKVKLLGACSGCPFRMQTLKSGVEQILKKEVPEIKEVVAV